MRSFKVNNMFNEYKHSMNKCKNCNVPKFQLLPNRYNNINIGKSCVHDHHDLCTKNLVTNIQHKHVSNQTNKHPTHD